jgi:hypothetical protein
LESVAEYIAKQREHHRVTPFREEYLNFLNRHKVEYDAGVCEERTSPRRDARWLPTRIGQVFHGA